MVRGEKCAQFPTLAHRQAEIGGVGRINSRVDGNGWGGGVCHPGVTRGLQHLSGRLPKKAGRRWEECEITWKRRSCLQTVSHPCVVEPGSEF